MQKVTGNVEATRRAVDALPKHGELKRSFGKRFRQRKGSTKFMVDLGGDDASGRRARGLMSEMLEPSNAIANENARAMQAQIPMTEVVDRRGRRRMVAVRDHEGMERRGAIRVVRRPSTIERWSDGLLYKMNAKGKMECMGKCSLSTPYVPCKNPRCSHCGEGME